jgi:hypothetical protein
MTKTKPSPLTIPTLSPVLLESTRTESLTTLSANEVILTRVSSLLITDQTTYLSADHELSLIRAARRHIQANIIDPVKAPINASHKAILKLEHQLDDGLAAAETALRRKMSDYQVGERRKIEAREVEERARREAEEKERRRVEEDWRCADCETAQSERQRELDKDCACGGRFVSKAQREEASQQGSAVYVANREEFVEGIQVNFPSTPRSVYVPPVSIHSSSRPVQRVRVVNLDELLIGIIEKHVPEDVISVVESALNRYLRDAPDVVATWPGVEVYDDVQIRGR